MNKIFVILLPIIQLVTAILAEVVFFQSLAKGGAMLTLILGVAYRYFRLHAGN